MADLGHVETRYGVGLLSEQAQALQPYVAVIDPTAWGLCRDSLPADPVQVVIPESLDEDHLERLVGELHGRATIVGVGGGMVVDAAKYLALRSGVTPVLVPSISSSNAPFSDSISIRRSGGASGMVAKGQPKRVLIDVALIGQAEPRLNRAGYADLLAHAVALCDWREATRVSDLAWDARAASQVAAVIERCHAAAERVRCGDRDAVEFIMHTFEEVARLLACVPHVPVGSGSEHLVAWNLEAVTGRHFIHGEAVALGIAVAVAALGDDRRLCTSLETAGVSFRLAELGVTWRELERTLQTVGDYNRRFRGFNARIAEIDWTPERLAAVRDLVGGGIS